MHPVFQLHLERAHRRGIRAVLAREDEEGDEVEAAVEAIDALDDKLEAHDASADIVPMACLAMRLGLDETERDFVWAVVALATEPRLLVHALALVGSDARRGMSLMLYAILAELSAEAGHELALRLSAQHPLVRWRFLEIASKDSDVIGAAIAYRASARLIDFLAGERRSELAAIRVPASPVFDRTQELALARICEALGESIALVIEGPSASGRRTAIAFAAAAREVIAIDLARIGPSEDALIDALVALNRECVLRDAIPVIAGVDELGDRARILARFVDEIVGPIALVATRPGVELGAMRRTLRVDWPASDAPARRALWRSYLGDGHAVDGAQLDLVAQRYALGAGSIARAVDSARLLAQARHASIDAHDLVAGVRNNIADALGALARRVEVKQSWDDLVLAPDLLDQIHALIARVRHAQRVYEDWGFSSKVARGIGVPALFSGPPGTGKTMVAGIIARELELELLQVDLSQIVSKWVGETEKQLSRVFDAAEAGHALLLFDEADALFAKRTAVTGANDRYANLEVNYLLQRVEAFGGITILTTNFESAIDPALKRRLASHIAFWPPDEEERRVLWLRTLSTGSAPIARDVDAAKLARTFPDMTGANIRNAVLAAAFLAASEEVEIGNEHVERAARGEYRTMGRLFQ